MTPDGHIPHLLDIAEIREPFLAMPNPTEPTFAQPLRKRTLSASILFSSSAAKVRS